MATRTRPTCTGCEEHFTPDPITDPFYGTTHCSDCVDSENTCWNCGTPSQFSECVNCAQGGV